MFEADVFGEVTFTACLVFHVISCRQLVPAYLILCDRERMFISGMVYRFNIHSLGIVTVLTIYSSAWFEFGINPANR